MTCKHCGASKWLDPSGQPIPGSADVEEEEGALSHPPDSPGPRPGWEEEASVTLELAPNSTLAGLEEVVVTGSLSDALEALQRLVNQAASTVSGTPNPNPTRTEPLSGFIKLP